MANPPKRKGTAAETALLRWLHANGHPEAVRNPPAGAKDVGDLTLDLKAHGDCWCDDCIGSLTIEVKNVANVATGIREGLAELDVEKANAGTTHGAVVFKPRGVGLDRAGDWWVVRRLKDDPELGVQ